MSHKKLKMRKLQLAVGTIQKRWGNQAIHRANERTQYAEPASLSTGFLSVDNMLGDGLTRGHIAELIGTGTAGQMTLSAKTLQEAQRQRQQVTYIDLFQTIDLDFMERCGVHLDPLVVLRPLSFARAIEMIGDLLRSGGSGTIVLDRLTASMAGGHDIYLLEQALPEWNILLSRQLSTLLIVSELIVPDAYPYGRVLPHLAFTRLMFQWQGWIYQKRRVRGFTSQVTVLKNRVGAAQMSDSIRVMLDEQVHGGEV